MKVGKWADCSAEMTVVERAGLKIALLGLVVSLVEMLDGQRAIGLASCLV